MVRRGTSLATVFGALALLGATQEEATGAAPIPPRWEVERSVTDVGRNRTHATIVGRDTEKPVAGRVRIVAPRGPVWLSVEPVCFDGNRWELGGDTAEELTSRGSPILRALARGVVPYRSRSTEPRWCRWKVTASAGGGTLVLELQTRSRE